MTHFLQRTALIALATGALGACSTTETDSALRPNFPIRAEEVPPPAAPSPQAAATPAPLAPPVDLPVIPPAAAPVESRPLAVLPPARQAPISAPPTTPAPPPARIRAVAPPPPAYRTVTTRTVTGRVVEVQGRPVTYTVKKGDTLEKIAGKLDTTVSQLREDNDIGRREKIHPGQELKGPQSTAHAYVAGQGDTLYSIARRFDVTADDLREENDLGRNAGLRPGQKLRLPEGYRDRGPLVTTSRVAMADAAPPPAAAEEPDDVAPPLAPARMRQAADAPEAPAYRTVTIRTVTGRVIEVEGPPVSYTVKKGDSLEKIADKLDTTVAQLREDNDIGRRATIHPGQVLDGPTTTAHAYVAGQGDTLYSIGRRFGVTPEALRDENELGRNASLRAGQRIRLPEGYRDRGPLVTSNRVPVAAPPPAPAPVTTIPAPQPQPRPQPETPPVVRPPPPVAPRPYVPPPPSATPVPGPYTPPSPPPRTYTPPAGAPALPTPAPRPYTPPPTPSRTYTPPAGAPALPTPAPRPYTPPPAPPRSYTPPAGAPALPTPAAPQPGDAQLSELGRGRFIWPLQGQIISDFGPKAAGQRNDGINIAAQVGASVRAAASGDVVYAGDQVPGFGNLVLIKHADGWVTAYGHLSRSTVRMQQKVTQGAEIGVAGATGGVAEPQLHFEIRFAPSPLERAKPIDPKLVLPK